MLRLAASPITTQYDIFLSHAFLDVDVVAGIHVLLERGGVKVYVDWIEDPLLDRAKVTPATAEMLRRRMKMCRSLVYASSDASPTSKWMPWELGYFDGYRPGHVAILPLVESVGQGFTGQEYLGLYPRFELLDVGGQRLMGVRSSGRSVTARSFARGTRH